MKPKMLTRSTVAENLGVSVLTPTTLKSITQILENETNLDNGGCVDLLEDSYPIPSIILPSENSSSMTRSTFVNSDAKCWQGGTTTVVTPSSLLPQTILDKQDQDKRKENNINNNNGVVLRSSKRHLPRKANGGGRKPSSFNKNGQMLSPEEEARLKLRRERNKEAAARCRKRRVDQTNDLLEQVEEHEKIKRALEEEIRSLQCTKEELQFLLQTHSKSCIVSQSPSPPATGMPLSVQTQPQQPQQRPNSLPLLNKSPSFMDSFIETPTSAINFDSILTTSSTGLTPLANIPTPVIFSPTCSVQQREHEKSNSDSINLVSL